MTGYIEETFYFAKAVAEAVLFFKIRIIVQMPGFKLDLHKPYPAARKSDEHYIFGDVDKALDEMTSFLALRRHMQWFTLCYSD